MASDTACSRMQKLRRIAFRAGVLALALTLFPYVFSRIASVWRCTTTYVADEPIPADGDNRSLRVACYNLAHGRGQSRTNWTNEPPQLRLKRLDDIAELIRSVNADIVILNEVDFDSSWSHSLDQAQYLATAADYPYRVEQRNLDFRLLFWTWRFGNAILSRHPIKATRVLEFPGYSIFETLLVGKKRGIECSIEFADTQVVVAGVHLSHRSEALRARSTEFLGAQIIGGDFNSTPSGFPDSVADTAEGNAMDRIDTQLGFSRRPRNPPANTSELTFHSAKPKSVIDWILVSDDWHFVEYDVIPSLLSDHRMVVAEVIPAVNSAVPD